MSLDKMLKDNTKEISDLKIRINEDGQVIKEHPFHLHRDVIESRMYVNVHKIYDLVDKRDNIYMKHINGYTTRE